MSLTPNLKQINQSPPKQNKLQISYKSNNIQSIKEMTKEVHVHKKQRAQNIRLGCIEFHSTNDIQEKRRKILFN